MPIAFLIIGSVLIVAGVRDKAGDLWKLVQGDFTGDKSYIRWMVAILIIGSLGYIETIKPVSRAFLALMLLVLFLSNGGFFDKFNQDFFGGKLPTNLLPSNPSTSLLPSH